MRNRVRAFGAAKNHRVRFDRSPGSRCRPAGLRPGGLVWRGQVENWLSQDEFQREEMLAESASASLSEAFKTHKELEGFYVHASLAVSNTPQALALGTLRVQPFIHKKEAPDAETMASWDAECGILGHRSNCRTSPAA